ncbi:MAG: hypothetical protein LBS45_00120 [Synergistaceae bacterium]|jgi:hypothetical protein|nr:hypothetical protein [Synergistaceae bacterium]
MKLHELISEIEKRGIALSRTDDGRIKITPLEKAKGLIDEMKRRKSDIEAYVDGSYTLTPECLRDYVGNCETQRHVSGVSDRYPENVIWEAQKNLLVVKQVNGFFRLPTARERRDYMGVMRRRRKAA